MEETAKRTCQNCETELAESQRFCHNCGAEYKGADNGPTVCKACGKELASGQKFCPNCGSAVNAAPRPTVMPDRARKVNRAFIADVIKRSAALAVSILMVIFAFLPIINLTVDKDYFDIKEDINIKISPLDGVIFFADSLYNLDEEDIMDTTLYEELEELEDDYEEDWEEGEELDKLEKGMRKYIRLALRSNSKKLNPAQVMCAIMSVVYIAVAVASFIVSSVWFISLFCLKIRSLKKPAVMLIGAMLPLTAAMFTAFDVAYPQLLSKAQDYEGSITPIAVLTMIFSFALLAYFAVSRIYFEEKVRAKASEIIKRTLSIGFATTLLFLSFAPFITTKVKAQFNEEDRAVKAETTVDASAFSNIDMTDEQIEAVDDMKAKEIDALIKFRFDYFSFVTKKDYEKGNATANETILHNLALYYGGYEYSAFFTFGGFMTVLVAFLAAIIVWLNLSAVALGIKPHSAINVTTKAFIVIAAIFALVVAIVVASLVTANAKIVEIDYSASVAGGGITMVIFAVLTACVPMGAPKGKKPKVNEEFYAEYVGEAE